MSPASPEEHNPTVGRMIRSSSEPPDDRLVPSGADAYQLNGDARLFLDIAHVVLRGGRKIIETPA